MPHQAIRAALRHGTGDLHAILDQQVGRLDTASAYIDYLRGSYAFRAAIEPAIQVASEGKSWEPVLLADAIACDLAHLGVPRPGSVPAPQVDGRSAAAGALYVIEGSALGANLIFKQAAALGFTAGFGATHLARQTEDRGRWRAFLEWLDTTNCHVPDAVAAARTVFGVALAAYGAKADDCRGRLLAPLAGEHARRRWTRRPIHRRPFE